MKQAEIIQGLLDLAKNLGITIRKDNGILSEGLCTVKEKKIILIRKNSSPDRVIRVLAHSLSSLDLDDLYIKPFLREELDSEKQNRILLNKSDSF